MTFLEKLFGSKAATESLVASPKIVSSKAVKSRQSIIAAANREIINWLLLDDGKLPKEFFQIERNGLIDIQGRKEKIRINITQRIPGLSTVAHEIDIVCINTDDVRLRSYHVEFNSNSIVHYLETHADKGRIKSEKDVAAEIWGLEIKPFLDAFKTQSGPVLGR